MENAEQLCVRSAPHLDTHLFQICILDENVAALKIICTTNNTKEPVNLCSFKNNHILSTYIQPGQAVSHGTMEPCQYIDFWMDLFILRGAGCSLFKICETLTLVIGQWTLDILIFKRTNPAKILCVCTVTLFTVRWPWQCIMARCLKGFSWGFIEPTRKP